MKFKEMNEVILQKPSNIQNDINIINKRDGSGRLSTHLFNFAYAKNNDSKILSLANELKSYEDKIAKQFEKIYNDLK